jgi:hypothetical protein
MMKKPVKLSPEVMERAVRMVFEARPRRHHQQALPGEVKTG